MCIWAREVQVLPHSMLARVHLHVCAWAGRWTAGGTYCLVRSAGYCASGCAWHIESSTHSTDHYTQRTEAVAALDKRASELQSREATLARQASAVSEREAVLASREAGLASRGAALEQREAAVAHAEQVPLARSKHGHPLSESAVGRAVGGSNEG